MQSPLLVIGHLLKLCFSILFICVYSRHLTVGIEMNGFQVSNSAASLQPVIDLLVANRCITVKHLLVEAFLFLLKNMCFVSKRSNLFFKFCTL